MQSFALRWRVGYRAGALLEERGRLDQGVPDPPEQRNSNQRPRQDY